MGWQKPWVPVLSRMQSYDQSLKHEVLRVPCNLLFRLLRVELRVIMFTSSPADSSEDSAVGIYR